MARRLAQLRNDVMARAQLEDFRRNRTLLSPHLVKEGYRQATDKLRLCALPTVLVQSAA
jgi:hypothetical protein